MRCHNTKSEASQTPKHNKTKNKVFNKVRAKEKLMSFMEMLSSFIMISFACRALIVGVRDFRIALIACNISGLGRRNFFSFRKKQFNLERHENNINLIDFSISLVKVTMFENWKLDIIL